MGTIDDYLAELDDDTDRAVIDHIYTTAREVVPDAEQGKGYGKPLLSVMRAEKHIGIYPFSPEAVSTAAPELEGLDMDKGTIRFQPSDPPSDDAIRTLVTARRDQIG